MVPMDLKGAYLCVINHIKRLIVSDVKSMFFSNYWQLNQKKSRELHYPGKCSELC